MDHDKRSDRRRSKWLLVIVAGLVALVAAASAQGKATKASEQLQGKATQELEEKLCDLQPELSDVVNKVTREALKQKARQLGSVKEVSEDEETGSLTIKIEV